MAESSPDIAVIGAGVIGCAVAWELARRGARVELLDSRDVALGATQASAGVLAPYIEGHEKASLLDLTIRGLALYDEFIDRLRADGHGPAHYYRTGTLETAADAGAASVLQARARVLASRGVEAEFLDATAVRDAEPHLAADTAGGLLVRTHGFVNAPELTFALWQSASARGVRTRRECRVSRLSSDGPHLRIDTDEGAMTAAHVVLAAGSWSGQIAAGRGATVPVRPVRGQLLHLDWPGTPLHRVVWGPSCYLVPWTDGSLLVGATVEEAGFDERATTTGVHDLLQAACELVPHGWQAGFAGVRVGLRPATADELPIIGRSTRLDGLVYATGHYRNGILLAPLTAKLVADLVLDGHAGPELELTSPARFGDC
ncbi:MAG TPA: glycine oxidase ThiO [Vicinamibacterales bacterium]|nr:glycine oxidase ThiO [Vicinamibacterales bacterium]